jgi:NCAIR mutase (PurE)-related protein
MNPEALSRLLKDLYANKTTPERVLKQLKTLPFEDLGFAQVDHHRSLRSGMPEVIYCEGKSSTQIAAIIRQMFKAGHEILATRLTEEVYKKIKTRIPGRPQYNKDGRTLVIRQKRAAKKIGKIQVITAGTSDIPVAEEAAITAELLGSRVNRLYDVGVAGIHRLLDKLDMIREARVLIVAAGMDGALVSVVGGLVDRPVIGVPTSVGYGTSFEGVSALLTMLNSCASGVGAVNIDNGFGAGCLAHKINLLGETENS